MCVVLFTVCPDCVRKDWDRTDPIDIVYCGNKQNMIRLHGLVSGDPEGEAYMPCFDFDMWGINEYNQRHYMEHTHVWIPPPEPEMEPEMEPAVAAPVPAGAIPEVYQAYIDPELLRPIPKRPASDELALQRAIRNYELQAANRNSHNKRMMASGPSPWASSPQEPSDVLHDYEAEDFSNAAQAAPSTPDALRTMSGNAMANYPLEGLENNAEMAEMADVPMNTAEVAEAPAPAPAPRKRGRPLGSTSKNPKKPRKTKSEAAPRQTKTKAASAQPKNKAAPRKTKKMAGVQLKDNMGIVPNEPEKDMVTAPDQPENNMVITPNQPDNNMVIVPNQPENNMIVAPGYQEDNMVTVPDQPENNMVITTDQPKNNMIVAPSQPEDNMAAAPDQPMAAYVPQPTTGVHMQPKEDRIAANTDTWKPTYTLGLIVDSDGHASVAPIKAAPHGNQQQNYRPSAPANAAAASQSSARKLTYEYPDISRNVPSKIDMGIPQHQMAAAPANCRGLRPLLPATTRPSTPVNVAANNTLANEQLQTRSPAYTWHNKTPVDMTGNTPAASTVHQGYEGEESQHDANSGYVQAPVHGEQPVQFEEYTQAQEPVHLQEPVQVQEQDYIQQAVLDPRLRQHNKQYHSTQHGHQVNGHWVDGHQGDGHHVNGHQVDDHQGH